MGFGSTVAARFQVTVTQFVNGFLNYVYSYWVRGNSQAKVFMAGPNSFRPLFISQNRER